jgi:hypothetical protein
MIYVDEVSAHPQKEGATDRSVIFPIPKGEPPLESSYVFPAEVSGGLGGRGDKKKASKSVSKNRQPSFAII